MAAASSDEAGAIELRFSVSSAAAPLLRHALVEMLSALDVAVGAPTVSELTPAAIMEQISVPPVAAAIPDGVNRTTTGTGGLNIAPALKDERTSARPHGAVNTDASARLSEATSRPKVPRPSITAVAPRESGVRTGSIDARPSGCMQPCRSNSVAEGAALDAPMAAGARHESGGAHAKVEDDSNEVMARLEAL
eukprot:2044965-Prymnesium_polylepis.1